MLIMAPYLQFQPHPDITTHIVLDVKQQQRHMNKWARSHWQEAKDGSNKANSIL